MKPCPHPACERRIGDELFACRPHWFSLSAELRTKIWRDFRRGALDDILANYDAAEAEWS